MEADCRTPRWRRRPRAFALSRSCFWSREPRLSAGADPPLLTRTFPPLRKPAAGPASDSADFGAPIQQASGLLEAFDRHAAMPGADLADPGVDVGDTRIERGRIPVASTFPTSMPSGAPRPSRQGSANAGCSVTVIAYISSVMRRPNAVSPPR
jgi:hypothetical protein